MTRFTDRAEAGRALAKRLAAWADRDVVVLALPRGGVPVAFEIAQALHAPLDLVLVRKIGAPDFEELAIGAIADGPESELVTDPALIRRLRVPAEYLTAAKASAQAELERRRAAYLQGRPRADITGKTVILVDDGLATGATMRAALQATRARNPARLIVAVPVGAADSLARCAALADTVECLLVPDDFGAVGQHYERFPQLRDDEVSTQLDQAARLHAARPAGPGGGQPH